MGIKEWFYGWPVNSGIKDANPKVDKLEEITFESDEEVLKTPRYVKFSNEVIGYLKYSRGRWCWRQETRGALVPREVGLKTMIAITDKLKELNSDSLQ